MFLLAKYNTQTTFTFPMVKRGVVDLAATADWTPATGDTKITKDGGNVANTTNNPAAVGGTGSVTWTLTLTATELTAGVVDVQIVDSATKAVEDQFLKIYTYGHASAKIPIDLSTVIENQVWDALRSNHVVAGSVGLLPRGIATDGTAQSGAASSITLSASEPTTLDLFKGAVVAIYAGAGAGQARMITTYSTGRVASVVPNWITAPDNTSKYIIHAFADPVFVGQDNKVILSTDAHTGVTIPTVTSVTNSIVPIRQNTAQAGSSASITLDAGASATSAFYSGLWILLTGGTGAGQVRLCNGYNGGSKVATVYPNWITAPDSSTTFSLLPASAINGVTVIGDGAISTTSFTSDTINDSIVSADMDAYHAKVWVVKEGITADHYGVIFFKNGQPVTSGITSPTIQVVKASDGTDLVASTGLTEVGSLGIYKKDETSNKMSGGAMYFAKVTATIDGSSRQWLQQVGRDST